MTFTTSQSTWHGWRLFALLAVAVLCMTALVLALQAQPVEGLRSAIRTTARSSFALFLAAFLASSLATLVPGPGTRALLRERRYLGLAFAFSHAVHAVLILAYWKLFPETFWSGRSVAANIPGSIGYLFILLLTLTSFRPRPDCSAHAPGKPCTRPAPGCWRASSACRSSNASPWAAGTYWRSPRSSPPSSSSSPPSSPCACVVETYSRPDPSTAFNETSIMQASDLRAWRLPFALLDRCGGWCADLSLRLFLAWEFFESGWEKWNGENWFGDIQSAFPFPFDRLPAAFNWELSLWAELLGALFLLLGLGTRLTALVLIVVTLVATAAVHWPAEWSSLAELARGYSITDHGFGNFKLPAIYLAALLPLLLAGAGKLSLDHWLGRRLGLSR